MGHIVEYTRFVRRGQFIEEIFHPAGNGYAQIPGWGLQRIVKRMGNLFRQVRYAASARLQRLIAEPDFQGAFHHMHNFIFIVMHVQPVPASGVELEGKKIKRATALLEGKFVRDP